MPHRHRIWIWGAFALTAASLSSACRTTVLADNSASSVPVASAQPATLANDLTLSAEFRPYQEVDVMAKVAGYVREIRVDIGDHVREGDIVATLEAPEFRDEAVKARAGVAAAQASIANAQAGVERARAGERIAELSYQRIRDVATRDPGLVPRQELDVAEARHLDARAQAASADSALRLAQERLDEARSESSRAAAMLAYTTIRAPFSGVITKRFASVGSMIQAGTASQTQAMPLVSLAQNNVLRLMLPVPVKDVGAIRDGQAVSVEVASLGRTLRGQITRHAGNVEAATRTMDTEVDVPNPGGELVPGMYAQVTLHLAERPNVLCVPLDAVDGIGTASQQVYVVRDGTLRLTRVTIGIETPTRIEIVTGLRSGDQVVVGRRSGLYDGQRVVARTASYEQS